MNGAGQQFLAHPVSPEKNGGVGTCNMIELRQKLLHYLAISDNTLIGKILKLLLFVVQLPLLEFLGPHLELLVSSSIVQGNSWSDS